MKAGVNFLSSDRCLITWLRDNLQSQNKSSHARSSEDSCGHVDLESTWVVLPTRRLAGALNAALAASACKMSSDDRVLNPGALLSPRVMNFDDFLNQLPDALQSASDEGHYESLRILESDMAELLIHGLIVQMTGAPPSALSDSLSLSSQTPLKHIVPDHAHEIAHLISSAMDQGLNLDLIAPAAMKILRDEIYRSDEQVCVMTERVAALGAVIKSFHALLQNHNCATPEMQRSHLAATAVFGLANSDSKSFVPWERLVFAGFTSMAATQIPLLQALSRRDDVSIVLTAPSPHWRNPDAPIERLAKAMGWAQKNTTEDKADKKSSRQKFKPQIATHIASERQSEARFALAMSMDLAKTTQGSVAILLPDESTYEPWFRRELEDRPDLAKNFNLAPPSPLPESLLGSWFIHMAAFMRLDHDQCNEESRQTAAAFLTHPFQFLKLPPDDEQMIVEPVVIRACLMQALASVAKITEIPEKLRSMHHAPANAVAAASGIIHRSLNIARYLRRHSANDVLDIIERELEEKSQWLTENRDTSEVDDGQLAEKQHDESAENSPVEALRKILFDLKSALSLVPTDASNLLENFVKKVSATGIRKRGEPLSGVQILTLAEARHFPFAAAIIVGCNEGVFPRSLPKDRLLDQYLLRRLGLPTWNELEAIEDTTFNLLRERVPKLILTCSLRDSDRPLIPSRYIEMLKTLEGIVPKSISDSRSDNQPPASSADRTEPSDSHASPGHMAHAPGPIMTTGAMVDDGSQNLSASRLGTWIGCPYHYALNSQGGQPADDYESLRQARLGNWLHESIQAAFKDFPGGDVQSNIEAGKNAKILFERLSQASDRSVPEDFLTSDLPLHLKKWSWLRLVEFFERLWSTTSLAQRSKRHVEKSFVSQFGENSFGGVIDHFEDLGSVWLLLDYKTTAAPRKSEIAKGIRPQLAVYAAALADEYSLDLNRCIAGHFEILKGKWVSGFVGSEARSTAAAAGLITSREKILSPQDAIDSARTMLNWRKGELAADKIGFHAPDVSQCGWCPNSNICRKDDPRYQNWFGQPHLSRRLNLLIKESR